MKAKLLTVLAAVTAAAQIAQANYEAHEWGTFTSLVGSNGITQHGMYHEDEALPRFVHGFGAIQAPIFIQPGDDRNRPCRHKGCFMDDQIFENNVISQKMETPVIYFYGQPQKISVNVRFPEGVVTETYPAPVATSPMRQDLKKLGNGNTTFEIELLEQVDPLPNKNPVPAVSATDIYGHARNVKSQLIKSGREIEKFIFYRGIGRFQPRFGITSKDGNLHISSNPASRPSAAFLVHVDAGGGAQMLNIDSVPGGMNKSTISTQLLDVLRSRVSDSGVRGISRGPAMRNNLIKNLIGAGLNEDEATAMIDTWEHGYLKVPGLRLLYILPKDEVDEVLPLVMTPAPQKIERVFIGRIEVLLDTEEARIMEQILKDRQAYNVAGLGRFAEPMLRRVFQVYQETAQLNGGIEPANIALFESLIKQAAKAETPSGLL